MATINGGTGNDSLIGTGVGDSISGSSGNDTLLGGGGADSLFGGTGNDRASYATSGAAVNVSLTSNTGIGGDAQGDILNAIEDLTGSAFGDTLTGNTGANALDGGAGNDSLYGGSGNDTLTGGAGADRLDGGTGTDTADYAGAGAAVALNLATGGTAGDAAGDIFVSIEAVVGSAHNDSITGNTGTNSLYGGLGEDVLAGGAGTDYLFGGDNNDVLAGGTNNDSLSGGAGIDTADYSAAASAVNVSLATGSGTVGDANGDTLTGIENLSGSAFADTLTGDANDNRIWGGAGADNINAGSGNDTIAGGAGADTIVGGEDLDIIDYSASGAGISINLGSYVVSGGDAAGDVLSGIDGVIGSAFNDTIIGFDNAGLSGDIYTNLIFGGGGEDYIDGLGSNDSLYGGTGNDTVLGGSGDDTVQGEAGNDSLLGGTGNDLLYGGAGNDTLTGGTGNDQVYGGDGDDLLVVSTGDSVFGGTGNDVFQGSGAATLSGGDGSDTFVGKVADTIDGAESGGEMDVLDLTGLGPLDIAYDPGNPENGVVTFYNGLGQVTGTMTFLNIETVVPCFTPGTKVACAAGEVAVEALKPGDVVLTRDHGPQVLRWVGRKRLGRAELAADAKLQPVLIKAGALGAGLPVRDMKVSRQHRMLVSGPRAELLFGTDEVLVRAEHLVHLAGVAHAVETEVTYLHLLFDRHEVVLADGAWSESFQPGDRTLAGLDAEARDELFKLFPALARGEVYPAARPTLKRFEAKVLTAA